MRPAHADSIDAIAGGQVPARISLTDAQIRQALERIADLSLLEEQLLFRLCCLSLLRGYAWMGQGELARLLRCGERTVRDAIRRVCDRGLLETTRSQYGLSYRPQWAMLGLRPGLAKFAGPDRQILPVLTDQQRDQRKAAAELRAAPTGETQIAALAAAAVFSKPSIPEGSASPSVTQRRSASPSVAPGDVDGLRAALDQALPAEPPQRPPAPPSAAAPAGDPPVASRPPEGGARGHRAGLDGGDAIAGLERARLGDLRAELAQVGAKYGPDAETDARDVVLSERPRLEAARQAIARLLEMDRECVGAPGACLRTYVRLAKGGRLAAPARAAPITAMGRLLEQIATAHARGDAKEEAWLREQAFLLGQRLQREARMAG